MLDNAGAAAQLELLAELLELTDSSPFKPRAYRNAARSLLTLPQPYTELLAAGTLTDIPGIGKGVASALRELQDAGRMAELELLLEKIPHGVLDLRRVPGLGAKKLKTLFERGITSLEQLEAACRDGTLAGWPGFGAKSVAKLLDGVLQLQSFAGLWRRPRAQRVAALVKSVLCAEPGVRDVQVSGPLRREMELVSQLVWIVVSESEPDRWQASLSKLDDLSEVRLTAPDRVSLRWADGFEGSVRRVPERAAGNALLESTGPEAYVRFVRERPAGEFASEEAMLGAAGLPLLPPECRDFESNWERGAPPDLLTAEDLRGVLHCHTTYSDGKASLAEMVEGAAARGLTYFGVCDHSRSAAYAGGLSVERIREQHAEIDRLNAKWGDRIRIFKGIESDILADGSLDYPDDVLALFDFVVASVHSGLEMDEETATERVCRAMRNPYTTILGHPTGRLLLDRKGYPLDWPRVVRTAKEEGVVIELNAHPWRLDVDWRHLPLVFSEGVQISINPDAHALDGLDDMRHGVAVARKAGARTSHVLNCKDADELARFFQKARS